MTASSQRKAHIMVIVAGKPIETPIYVDEETTRALAAMVTEQIRAIEKKSVRIDTQTFALQAAMDLAAQLHALREEKNQADQELLRILGQYTDRLRDLIQTLVEP